MRIILVIALLVFFYKSSACSCEWGGNFLNNVITAELIFKGNVVGRTFHLSNGEEYHDLPTAYKSKNENKLDEFYGMGESITIEVIELIKGTEERKRIRIFDSDGADCRESIGNFKIGSTYIFSTYKPNREEPKLPSETTDDYAIYGCTENWLEFLPDTNEVFGRINGKSHKKKLKTMAYNKFLEEITEHNML